MTTRDTPWPEGTPSWVDLSTTDRDAAAAFYRSLFGWDVVTDGEEYGGYATCLLEGRPVAGIAPLPQGDEGGPGWTTYLSVEDAARTAEAITAQGGTVVLPPMQVGDQGRMAIAQDPTGAFFGLWEPGAHVGFQVVNQPGSVVWNECLTRDPDRARTFYSAVFGHSYTPVEGAADYTGIDGDGPGDTVGGIGALDAGTPPEVPSHWLTYFAVSNTDQVAVRVTEGGGTVQAGPFDSPFGRIAVVRDPQGAIFSIIGATGGTDSDQG